MKYLLDDAKTSNKHYTLSCITQTHTLESYFFYSMAHAPPKSLSFHLLRAHFCKHFQKQCVLGKKHSFALREKTIAMLLLVTLGVVMLLLSC
jgi:hypothetical protein